MVVVAAPWATRVLRAGYIHLRFLGSRGTSRLLAGDLSSHPVPFPEVTAFECFFKSLMFCFVYVFIYLFS